MYSFKFLAASLYENGSGFKIKTKKKILIDPVLGRRYFRSDDRIYIFQKNPFAQPRLLAKANNIKKKCSLMVF